MTERPFVVAHVAVSVDGATTGFQPDLARFYGLAATWAETSRWPAPTRSSPRRRRSTRPTVPARPRMVRCSPSSTVAAGSAAEGAARRRPWSDVVGIHAGSTPPRSGDHDEIVTGADRVDLAAALTALGRRPGVATVRVDSGGALTGALLRGGLLDEVSLLVHPLLAGPAGDRTWLGGGPTPRAALELVSTESFEGGLVWSRYRVGGVP